MKLTAGNQQRWLKSNASGQIWDRKRKRITGWLAGHEIHLEIEDVLDKIKNKITQYLYSTVIPLRKKQRIFIKTLILHHSTKFIWMKKFQEIYCPLGKCFCKTITDFYAGLACKTKYRSLNLFFFSTFSFKSCYNKNLSLHKIHFFFSFTGSILMLNLK